MNRTTQSFLGPSLTLIFIALKLLGYIEWSWWWVLSPLWLPVLVIAFIVFLGFLCALVSVAVDETKVEERRKEKNKNKHTV